MSSTYRSPLLGFLLVALAPTVAATVALKDQRAPDAALTLQGSMPWGNEHGESSDNAVMAVKLKGRWENRQSEQRIELVLKETGLSRWKVNYKGQAWSDLIGTWRARSQHLFLDNDLGVVQFTVHLTEKGDLILADTDTRDPIAPLRFERLD